MPASRRESSAATLYETLVNDLIRILGRRGDLQPRTRPYGNEEEEEEDVRP